MHQSIYKAERHKKSKLSALTKTYLRPTTIILVTLIIVLLPVRFFLIVPVKIKTNSMTPIVSTDRVVFLYKKTNFTAKQGDVVVVKNSRSLTYHFCRILAIENTNVKISGNILSVNNQKQVDISFDKKIPKNIPKIFFPGMQNNEMQIPQGEFYCVNDNRDNVQDSRLWGNFLTKNIVGKFLFKGFPGF